MKDALESFKNLGLKKLAILGAAGVALLVGLIVLATNVSSGSMSPLYTNLTLEDANKITTELDGKGVQYQMAGNGTQILVPAEQALKLRMAFAAEGIPSSGTIIGYEIFDKDEKLGTSNFVQNMNQLRALEGELARTIMSMNQIKNARVHLVVPKNELFRKDKVEVTASITVTMGGSEKLNPGEVAAIRYLVASAVPGLAVENVTIVDSRGVLLARGGSDKDDPAVYASNSQEFRSNTEAQLRDRVEELLEKYVGMGNVKAQVAAEINFDRTVTEEETYDPESQVARSVQTTEENEASDEKSSNDNVSVANNLPNASAGGANNNTQKKNRTDEVTNYEISKKVTNHVSETGTVKKLSIAVLIDGIYEEDPKTGEAKYKERTPEEIAKLTALVKSAIGFDDKRGDSIEITSLQFSQDFGGYKKESTFEFLQQDLQSVIQILVMGLVAMMVIFMVIRPLVKRALEVNQAQQAALEASNGVAMIAGPGGTTATGQPAQAQIAGPGGNAMNEAFGDEEEGFSALSGIRGPQKSASIKKINELIENNSEEAASVLRSWLYGENAA
jgi:flagellar M-ring protein FliF